MTDRRLCTAQPRGEARMNFLELITSNVIMLHDSAGILSRCCQPLLYCTPALPLLSWPFILQCDGNLKINVQASVCHRPLEAQLIQFPAVFHSSAQCGRNHDRYLFLFEHRHPKYLSSLFVISWLIYHIIQSSSFGTVIKSRLYLKEYTFINLVFIYL